MAQVDRTEGLVGNTAIKAPCAVATAAAITLSGEQTIDGVVTSSSRVLVKDQDDALENGIYVSSSSEWQRADDFDGSRDITTGSLIKINGGSTQSGMWEVSTAGNPKPGTDDIEFVLSSFGYTPDPDTLYADVPDVLFAGFATTPYNAGTKSSGTYTPDEANGNMQYCVNGGAFTLAPPTNNCTLVIQITNNASAGAITTSGFTKVSGSAPGTTDGDDFLAYITKINGFSHINWVAMQ